ncbi:hypothetical protein [Ferrimonas sediminum]|nr:hypothetical protein [Ferrimonas sediminum]
MKSDEKLIFIEVVDDSHPVIADGYDNNHPGIEAIVDYASD